MDSNIEETRFLIITGMSGAGKTQVIRTLEDLGFFCVDNFPPALIDKFVDMSRKSEGQIRRVALVIDIRGGLFFNDLFAALENLEMSGFAYQILFLEATDEVLVRRFKETRRRHPLAGEGSILEAIEQERRRLEDIRGRANWIIDTSMLTTRQLSKEIKDLFSEEGEAGKMIIHFVSFGYKWGVPMDADLLFDVRFLPNPHYVDSLKFLDGTTSEVRDYVFKWPLARKFIQKCHDFIGFLLPHYINEGKTQLTIAIGCTGGRHRSVAIVDYLAAQLSKEGFNVNTEHRDTKKENAGVDA